MEINMVKPYGANASRLNTADPRIMHIDLNSCFATVEQQAHPHLRNKPLVIAAYTSPKGCVLSPSIEAKRYGIKTGMRVYEAQKLCPSVIVRETDPPLVRDVHIKFRTIFQDYSPSVTPKSIDEAVLDFTSMDRVLGRSLEDVGLEIKYRLRKEVGDWISCNVGIAPNRFLAKIAAGLHKPDGLDTITHKNLHDTFAQLELTDLPGINVRYEARLHVAGIFSPTDFLKADMLYLKKRVFRSVVGYYWYQRLRGWEVDGVDFSRKSYGQDYSLKRHTANAKELGKILMKLCEKMGRRLRRAGCIAHGVHVACLFRDGTYWHTGRKSHQDMYTTQELYRRAWWILNNRPRKDVDVSKLSVSCYDLEKTKDEQISIFDMDSREKKVSVACDMLNDRYGEFTVVPATMMSMDRVVLDRISFGNVQGLHDLYS